MTKGFFAVFLFVASSAVAQSSALDRDQIYAGLVGEWTGQLEYRDFTSNERRGASDVARVKSDDRRALSAAHVHVRRRSGENCDGEFDGYDRPSESSIHDDF